MEYSKDEIMHGLYSCYHLSRSYLKEINDGGFDECFSCPFRPDGEDTCDTLEPLFEAMIELLKAEEAKPLRCGGLGDGKLRRTDAERHSGNHAP